MINIVELLKNIKFLDKIDLDNKKLMLIAIVSVILLYVDFSFILKIQLSTLNKNSTEITKLNSDINNLTSDLKKMQDLKSKQGNSLQKAPAKAKRFLTENLVASFLQDISKLANNNDISILQIKPHRESQTNSPESKIKVIGNTAPLFVNLDLSCGYHQLGKFINDLENLQTFVLVSDVKIASQNDNYLKQKVTLTLIVYVKK